MLFTSRLKHFSVLQTGASPVVSVYTPRPPSGPPSGSELPLAAVYANIVHFSINLAVRSKVLNIDLAFHAVIYPEFS